MDSVDITEDTNQDSQLDDSLLGSVPETDTETSEEIVEAHDDDTDEFEVVIEGEDEQQESSKEAMTPEQTKAAWLEEKRKRKAKNEEIAKRDAEIAELREQLSGVSSKVSEITRGPRPKSEDFADDDQFLEALEKWKGEPQVKQPSQTQPQSFQLDDETEFELHTYEESMKKIDPKYNEVKKAAYSGIAQAFGMQGNEIGDRLVASCVMAGVDPAKVLGVAGRSADAIEKIKKASLSNSQLQLNKALRSVEAMHKLKPRQKVTTRPEESISGNGQVSNKNAVVDAAFKKWSSDPSAANYQAYAAAKKKVNANG